MSLSALVIADVWVGATRIRARLECTERTLELEQRAERALDPAHTAGQRRSTTRSAWRRHARVQRRLRAAPVGCRQEPQARRRQVDVSSGTVMTTVHQRDEANRSRREGDLSDFSQTIKSS